MQFDTNDDEATPKPDLHTMTEKALRDELHTTRVRIQLAQTFVNMLLKAYDALLHHGINYQTLPEWKDTRLIDRAAKEELSLGQSSMIEWMRRVVHGVEAAIRRKGFKRVT